MITESLSGSTSAHSSLGEAFQTNTVPLALIGIGIAWLLATNTGLTERVVQDQRVQAARRRIGDIASDLGMGAKKTESDAGRSEQILGPTGEPAIRTGDTGRTNGWVHQAADAAWGAVSSVRDAGSAVLDRAGKYADYAGDVGDLAKRVGDPWLIGIFGMVAGGVIAALLPPTNVEQECIGEARDGLLNKATEIGHEAAERVRELAESTTRASTHHAPKA